MLCVLFRKIFLEQVGYRVSSYMQYIKKTLHVYSREASVTLLHTNTQEAAFKHSSVEYMAPLFSVVTNNTFPDRGPYEGVVGTALDLRTGYLLQPVPTQMIHLFALQL